MGNSELISIVIPVKNRGKLISRTIDSVLKQKGDFTKEIIVVDDASTDNTKEIIKRYCKKHSIMTLIENKESLGGAAARNIGAVASTGRFIAFLDSDDEWKPNHLLHKLELMQCHNAQGCFGAFDIIKSGKKIVSMDLPSLDERRIIDYIFLMGGDTRTSTFVFDKKLFMTILFDDKLLKHQDWDLAIRFSEKYKLILDEEKLVNIYINVSNRMSNSNNYKASEYFLKKHQKKLSIQALYNFKLNLCFNAFRFEGNSVDFKERLSELTTLGKKGNLKHKKKYLLLHNRILRLFLPFLLRFKSIF